MWTSSLTVTAIATSRVCLSRTSPQKDISTTVWLSLQTLLGRSWGWRREEYYDDLIAILLSFSWSRWNLLSGYEKLIMQYKEKVLVLPCCSFCHTSLVPQVPGGPESGQKVMLVTPERTYVLECTEAR